MKLVKIIAIISIAINFLLAALLVHSYYKTNDISSETEQSNLTITEYSFSQIGELISEIDGYEIIDFKHSKTKYGDLVLLELILNQDNEKFTRKLESSGFVLSESVESTDYITLEGARNNYSEDFWQHISSTQGENANSCLETISNVYTKYTNAPLKEDVMNRYCCRVFILKDETICIVVL